MSSSSPINELRGKIAKELFDIWVEAKSSLPDGDNWNDETWENLPEKHQYEYYLTVRRIVCLLRAEIEKCGLTRKELEPIINKYGIFTPTWKWENHEGFDFDIAQAQLQNILKILE